MCFELNEKNVIWKTYLAPGLLKDDRGEIVWYELKSGDVGIVTDARNIQFGTVVVLISRLRTLIKVHIKRITTVTN